MTTAQARLLGPRSSAWIDALLDVDGREVAPAVIDASGVNTSFGELARRVGGLGQILRDAGVVPGDRVALQLPRSLDLIVAMLATLDVRAAYVVVDPRYPEERRRDMLAGSAPRLVLADGQQGNHLTLEPSVWRVACADRRPLRRDPDDLAYLAYTSGSTGRPKGVAVPVAALGDYLTWCRDALPALGHGVPLFASAAFDHAVTCLYPPLLAGEPIKLLPEIGAGERLGHDLLARAPYSFVKATPSHLRLLSLDQRRALGRGSGLVMLGGEPCDATLVASLRDDAPALRVMNHYGPTEATVGCTFHEIPQGPVAVPVPLGRPMPHVATTVNDGELVVGGRCLAAGYWVDGCVAGDAPPFCADADGMRWYRTGDRVTTDADGLLVHLGRVDRQVKVLGHRIEPAEVERALMDLDSVDAALVLQPVHGAALAAVVTPASGAPEPKLRAALAERLVAAAVPARVLRLEALPVTVHGKVDVPAVEELLTVAGDGAPPPAGDLRALVADAWREVLELEAVAGDDDFFDQGGDSLSVVELVDRIQGALGVEIELSTLFMAPTLDELVAALEQLGTGGRTDPGD